ncbi:response regulator [Phenylobacterium sp.]|uniref:response regulator n=1 Tax=Phenylobacterium sp. TaxID=1871053 RepID=UPI002DF49D1E|nr:response regulator [Phenylobacterium sp.]
MAAAARNISTNRRALVVDDEHHICELIAEMLGEIGFELECVRSDQEAYRRLSRAADFELLLVDVNLGAGTTGFDVARFARQMAPDLPILYVSGQTGRDSFKAFGVPGAGFIAKPFTMDELHQAVREALGEA